MTTYVVHNNGQPVSIGTVIANPLPAGLAAVALSDTDADRLLRQGWQWNPATLAVDIEPAPTPDPTQPDDALLIAAEQARRDAYDAVIAAGTLSMARINQANRAGMDAYLAVLGG